MKKLLIVGGTGMLGHKLAQKLADRFVICTTIRGSFANVKRYGIFDSSHTVENIDVASPADLDRAIQQTEPAAVVNCVGVVKQVPGAQDAIQTVTINSILPHRLAELSSRHGFRLVLISTDCVYRGDRGNYSEVDVPDAVDLYGRSKILGEVDAPNVITIRTSLIGRELASAHGLIEWFLGNRGGTIKGFRHAIFSGFPTVVFADIIGNLLTSWPDLRGIYHVSSDPIDKFSLLCLANTAFNAGITIIPDDGLVIDRSLDSTRFRQATGFITPSWNDMMERMAADLTPYDEWRK